MSRCPALLLPLALGGCHWVFPHAPGQGGRDLQDGTVAVCESCTFTPAATTCGGSRIRLHKNQSDVFEVSLEREGACSTLELGLEVQDPRPVVPGADVWLLDVGDSDTNNGFGGDSQLWNDAELEITSTDATNLTWSLALWANDYFTLSQPDHVPGKAAQLGGLGGIVRSSGRTILRVTVEHGRVQVESDVAGGVRSEFGPRDSGDPAGPCSLFCLGQWEKATNGPGDGILHVAFGRTILYRGGSDSTGVEKARIVVR